MVMHAARVVVVVGYLLALGVALNPGERSGWGWGAHWCFLSPLFAWRRMCCVSGVCSLVDSQVEEMPTPEMYAKIAAAAAAATFASVASELLRVSPRNELVPVALYVCVLP